jgi:sodium transport system permease protein
MAQKLAASGIDLSVMDNVRITMKSISTNTLLVMLAPMLIVSLLVSGGSSIAADSFAGEKERGTLEQLAVTQVKRPTLLLGKTIVVELVTLINALISLLAYFISLKIAPEVGELMGDTGESITFTFSSAVWLILSIVSFSMMVTAVLVFISLMAKSVKEAQANMAIITMLPSIVSILVMFASASNQSIGSMFIPIYNVIVSIKMIFADAVSAELLTAACISNLLYASVIYLLCSLNVKSNKFLT